MTRKQKSLSSLEKSVQSKITSIIAAFKQEYGDVEDGQGACHWQDVDWMVEYVRQVDHGSRRMKMKLLSGYVENGIRQLRLSDQQDGGEDSSESDDSSPEAAPLVHVPDTNSMNRMLQKNYQLQNKTLESEETAAATAESNSRKVSRPVTSTDEKPPAKKVRLSSNAADYAPPSVRYADLGGIEDCIEEVRELIEAPIAHPEIYLHLNISPPRGILLHGPPGCGKTQLARAVAGELGVPFIQISAPSVVSGMSGESEKKIRDVFTTARELAPCLLFIDEIDAITPKRETAQREMERRIVAQLLTCLDDLSLENTGNKPVIVIGATNRPDSLDTALRRAGRFDREISMGIPDEQARVSILKVLTSKLRLAGDFDFVQLAKLTPGYVGADLNALTTAAGVFAIKRIFGLLAVPSMKHAITQITSNDRTLAIESTSDESMGMDIDVTNTDKMTDSDIARFLLRHPNPLTEEELAPLAITMDDFSRALRKVQPSSKREGFASVPDVAWSDIGALASIRDELRMSIVEPIKHPDLFARVGILNPSGVLLWGPPGCGKTLLAKAVANESHCNFISVKGPELLNKYVGESERGVRQVFARARASAPCVIFFDELDALCPRRGDGSDSQTSERVVNQLLTELDGLEGRKNVYIIAATNRPDIIDRAMLRPGRFDKLLQVHLPTPPERHEILKTLCRKQVPLDATVDLKHIADDKRCGRYSGADLSSLLREAGLAALRQALVSGKSMDAIKHEIRISARHFDEAFTRIAPSVSEQDLKKYDRLYQNLLK